MTLDEMRARFAHWTETPRECFYDYPDCPTITFRLRGGKVEVGLEPDGRITAFLKPLLAARGREVELPDLERSTLDSLRELLEPPAEAAS